MDLHVENKVSIEKTNWFLENRKKIAIIIVALIVLISLVWIYKARTSGEVAALSLSPSATSVTAGTDFNLNLMLDTRNNNVVAVKGIIKYNPADFELRSWNTSSSVFAVGNECVFNSKSCEIIAQDAANGTITITQAKPTPGVNTASGQLAILTFRALKAITATTPNITVQYIAFQNYTDSDVIFDDGLGTDILSEVSNTTVSAILPVPTGLTATAFSDTQINLSWSAPSVNVGVTGYKIFRNNVQVGTSTTNSYQDKGLTPLTAYQYKISAYDASSHESAQTAQASATTLADTTKPTVPAGLTASNIQMNSINLTWTASTDDFKVAGYNIYSGTNKIGTATTAPNYQATGLTPETTYSLSVSAFDVAGNESDRSTAISPKTLADSQAPSVPANLTAQAISISQINLSWTASTDNVGVTGYNIYRNGTKIGTATTTSYQDKGLTVSTAYNYQISAYDAKNNESAKTATVTATTNSDTSSPTVPGSLTATPASMTQINLAWTASTDNVAVTGYRIYRNGTAVGTTATTSFQDTGLIKATGYSYAVAAYDAAGNQSAQTSPVSATTSSDTEKPSTPAGLTATPISMTQIDLTWTASTDNIGVVGYRIYRNGVKIKEQAETSFSDIELTAKTQYSYTVSAYDADGNESNQSAVVQATTLARKFSISDFSALVSDWLKIEASLPSDINNDGTVNSQDLGIMMSNWNK